MLPFGTGTCQLDNKIVPVPYQILDSAKNIWIANSVAEPPKKLLYSHFQRKVKRKRSQCGKKSKSSSSGPATPHQRSTPRSLGRQGVLTCQHCAFAAERLDLLQLHERFCPTQVGFTKIASKISSASSRSTPLSERLLMCPLCGLEVTTAASLVKHTRLVHTSHHVAQQFTHNKHATVMKLFK